MKVNESKKFLFIFISSLLVTALLCFNFVKTIGGAEFVSHCVGFLIPTADVEQKVKKISVSAKKALSLGENAERDKNSDGQTVRVNSLAYTPEDIKILMDNAEKDFDKLEKGGAIIQKTYSSESATQSEGNVYVKNTTGRDLDISETLKLPMALEKVNKGEISVLIFHTHTTETYQILDKPNYLKSFSPRSTNQKMNMIRVGEEIASLAGRGQISASRISP